MNACARLVLVQKENPSPPQIQQLEFAQECPITDSERAFLSRFLAYHPAAQTIVDELAGQIRQRGRGQRGIQNPRALAALLAREATRCGTDYWYNWQPEAELRQGKGDARGATHEQTQPAPQARAETIAAARIEAKRIKERHAERRLQLLQGGKK